MKSFCIHLTGRQNATFYFSFFDFDNILTAFGKDLMKKPPVFMIDIKSSYKLLLSYKDLRSRNFWQWKDGPLNIFINLYGNAFPLHCFFSLNKKVIAKCHLMIQIKCFAFNYFNENSSSLKWLFWNNGLSNMMSQFFRFFAFSCLSDIFVENFIKKTVIF